MRRDDITKYPVGDRHLITARQLTRSSLRDFFDRSQKYIDLLADRSLADSLSESAARKLFFCGRIRPLLGFVAIEPTTRTRMSFEAAMYRLGGNVILMNGIKNTSVEKKESWQDTAKVVSGYPDVLVVRHPDREAISQAMAVSFVPLINAGNESDEHPTQTLVDLLAMYRAHGRIDNLEITIKGDPKYGRAIRSLVIALALYPRVRINFVCHPKVRIGEDITNLLEQRGIYYEETTVLSKQILNRTDVLYLTRIQRERYKDKVLQKEIMKSNSALNLKQVAQLPPNSVILHPLPRYLDVALEVDGDARARYFIQSRDAVAARETVIKEAIEPWTIKNRWLPFEPSMVSAPVLS